MTLKKIEIMRERLQLPCKKPHDGVEIDYSCLERTPPPPCDSIGYHFQDFFSNYFFMASCDLGEKDFIGRLYLYLNKICVFL